MNINDREQYEAWFRIEYGQEPMPRTSPVHDFCWAGYKAGLESLRQQLAERDAELKRINHALNDDRVDITITAAEAIKELRQQVTLLRDALKQARQMIYYGEPQLGWSITRIDEVLDATKEQGNE